MMTNDALSCNKMVELKTDEQQCLVSKLYYKMSKKIAQLTKVKDGVTTKYIYIYTVTRLGLPINYDNKLIHLMSSRHHLKVVHYLNSRYEDGLLELEEVKVSRQNEINKVIIDSKVRIDHLEGEIISKSEELSNAAVKRREIDILLEDIRVAGRLELQELQMKSAKREGQLEASYKTKIETIIAEAEERNSRLMKSTSCFQEKASALQLSLNESLQAVREGEVELLKAKEAHGSEVKQILHSRESLRGQHTKDIQGIIQTEREKGRLSEEHLKNTLIAEKEKALAAERIRADQALHDSEQMGRERDTVVNKMYGLENALVDLRHEKQNLNNLVAIEKTRANAAESDVEKLQGKRTTYVKQVEELTTHLHESRNEIDRVKSSVTASHNKKEAEFNRELFALKLELHKNQCKAEEIECDLLRESRLAQERVQMEAEDAWGAVRVTAGIARRQVEEICKTLHETRVAAEEDTKTFSATLTKLETERDAALFNGHKMLSEMEEKQQHMFKEEERKRLAIRSELIKAQNTVIHLRKETNGALIAAGLNVFKVSKVHEETRDSLLIEAEKMKGLLEATTASIEEKNALIRECKEHTNIREEDLR